MSILKNIKHRIEYACFLSVEFIFRMMPLEAVSAFSGKGWRVIAPLTRRHARAIENLQKAFPDKSPSECDRIARDMWEVLGRTFGEFFHLDEIYESDRIDATDVEHAMAAFGDHRAVVCGAHQGNWEIGAMAPVRLGARPTGIYQRMSNPLVDRKVHERRARFYPGGLLEKSPNAGVQALRNIRNGGSLAILADLRERTGVNVPFFGRLAPSTPFPAHVARLLKVPLIAFAVVREPGVRFKLSLEVIEVPHTDDRDADVLAATASLHAALERSIRRHPEQWMWAHRRWG
jgi:KDO2-lipid IV(A) lauroyltransferase